MPANCIIELLFEAFKPLHLSFLLFCPKVDSFVHKGILPSSEPQPSIKSPSFGIDLVEIVSYPCLEDLFFHQLSEVSERLLQKTSVLRIIYLTPCIDEDIGLLPPTLQTKAHHLLPPRLCMALQLELGHVISFLFKNCPLLLENFILAFHSGNLLFIVLQKLLLVSSHLIIFVAKFLIFILKFSQVEIFVLFVDILHKPVFQHDA